jgi:hypothetical protein
MKAFKFFQLFGRRANILTNFRLVKIPRTNTSAMTSGLCGLGAGIEINVLMSL